MGASAVLTVGTTVVAAGATTTRTVRVRNTGQVVDSFLVDVVGDAAQWATVEPAELNLFPGEEGQLTVTFAPPRSSDVRAGNVPFAVRILSKEDTAGSVVEEGEIEVEAFTELHADVVPRTARASRRAKTEVAVDNLGNVPLDVELLVEDPEQQVKGTVEPRMVSLEPGRATFATVTVRPRRPFWRGPSKTLPYRVTVLPDGGRAPVYADGVVLQEQILPKWLLKAVLALLALAVVLFVLWQTLFKSTIESAARDAAAEEADAATEAAEQAAADAAAAEGAAAAAEEAAEDAAGETGGEEQAEDPAGEGDGGIAALLARGDQIDFRVASDAATGAGFVTTVAEGLPADQILLLTDIVFQNPAGDSGVIRVLRNDDVLLEVGLANFRDLDYHFVAPIQFDPGDQVAIAVRCENVPPAGACSPAAYFGGVVAEPEAEPAA